MQPGSSRNLQESESPRGKEKSIAMMKYADKLRNKYKERRMKNVIEPSEKDSSMSLLQEQPAEYKPQFNISKVITNTEMTAIEAE